METYTVKYYRLFVYMYMYTNNRSEASMTEVYPDNLSQYKKW